MILYDWHETAHSGICLFMYTFLTCFFTVCLVCQFGNFTFHGDVDNLLHNFCNVWFKVPLVMNESDLSIFILVWRQE